MVKILGAGAAKPLGMQSTGPATADIGPGTGAAFQNLGRGIQQAAGNIFNVAEHFAKAEATADAAGAFRSAEERLELLGEDIKKLDTTALRQDFRLIGSDPSSVPQEGTTDLGVALDSTPEILRKRIGSEAQRILAEQKAIMSPAAYAMFASSFASTIATKKVELADYGRKIVIDKINAEALRHEESLMTKAGESKTYSKKTRGIGETADGFDDILKKHAETIDWAVGLGAMSAEEGQKRKLKFESEAPMAAFTAHFVKLKTDTDFGEITRIFKKGDFGEGNYLNELWKKLPPKQQETIQRQSRQAFHEFETAQNQKAQQFALKNKEFVTEGLNQLATEDDPEKRNAMISILRGGNPNGENPQGFRITSEHDFNRARKIMAGGYFAAYSNEVMFQAALNKARSVDGIPQKDLDELAPHLKREDWNTVWQANETTKNNAKTAHGKRLKVNFERLARGLKSRMTVDGEPGAFPTLDLPTQMKTLVEPYVREASSDFEDGFFALVEDAEDTGKTVTVQDVKKLRDDIVEKYRARVTPTLIIKHKAILNTQARQARNQGVNLNSSDPYNPEPGGKPFSELHVRTQESWLRSIEALEVLGHVFPPKRNDLPPVSPAKKENEGEENGESVVDRVIEGVLDALERARKGQEAAEDGGYIP